MKQAGIYVNDIYCGNLTEDEEGFHFVYDGRYLARPDAVAVSPTMPLTNQQYDKEMMFPVFCKDTTVDVVYINTCLFHTTSIFTGPRLSPNR